MKQMTVVLLSILFVSVCDAQVTDTALAIVRYEFSQVIDSTQPESPIKDEIILLLGKNASLSTSDNYNEKQKGMKAYLQQNPAFIFHITINAGYPIIFYKQNRSNTLFSFSILQGNNYVIEEPIPVMDWKIIDETRNIQGYPSQKATTFFGGRQYEAWFCSQIPFNAGPWKLGGLPGLILEAWDSKKEVIFTLNSFDNKPTQAEPIVLPEKTIAAGKRELIKAILANQVRIIKPSSSGHAAGGDGGIADGPPVKRREYNNPVEKN